MLGMNVEDWTMTRMTNSQEQAKTDAVCGTTFPDVVIDMLKRGYGVCFRARGRSMNPTIQEGEKIAVEPVAPANVRAGHIVLYRSDRGVIAHRVVKIQRRRGDSRTVPTGEALIFLLRGDASRTCDEPIESTQILGKVVSVERDGHWLAPANRKTEWLRRIRAAASRLKQRIARIGSGSGFFSRFRYTFTRRSKMGTQTCGEPQALATVQTQHRLNP